MPRVMQVIESETRRGKGVDQSDPVRIVMQYHTLDGELLAERDRWAEERPACGHSGACILPRGHGGLHAGGRQTWSENTQPMED